MIRALARRWWRLPRAERVTAVEAVLFLVAAGPLVRIGGPVRAMRARCPGRAPRVATDRATAIVASVAAVLPFPTTCLVRAVALRWILRRRGEAAEVVLGVAREGDRFLAHAWVDSGSLRLDPTLPAHDTFTRLHPLGASRA